jgi:DNA-binding NtrC family response regulator
MGVRRDGPEDAATIVRKSTHAERSGAAGGEVTAAGFVLTVIAGPDRDLRFVVDAESAQRVFVGQSPACELRLSDPHVSRRHAALDLHGDRLRVTDLGSTNGTQVGSLSIGEAHLVGGEIVRLGDTEIAVSRADARGEAGARQGTLSTEMRFGRVIGGSVAMRRLFPLFHRLAASDVPLVIEGETGTGKELLAESLHEASARSKGPFAVFDCTTVAPTLVESALFGHERGAFTGATAMRQGVFEQAHGGTLLIDEIGELDLSLQPKLLRALERGEVQRVGGRQWIAVDVRVMAATRRDLDAEVQRKHFRDDLFFRLAVARLELPPLRERTGDAAILARQFWRGMGAEGPFPDEFFARFDGYAWPGNVRELYNVVARRLALGEHTEAPRALSAPRTEAAAALSSDAGGAAEEIERVLGLDIAFPLARQRVLETFERHYVERVLTRFGGNVTRAAAASGIARRYFHLILARHR